MNNSLPESDCLCSMTANENLAQSLMECNDA
jgi:hypothetical protein